MIDLPSCTKQCFASPTIALSHELLANGSYGIPQLLIAGLLIPGMAMIIIPGSIDFQQTAQLADRKGWHWSGDWLPEPFYDGVSVLDGSQSPDHAKLFLTGPPPL
jgi:hypothetical protein